MSKKDSYRGLIIAILILGIWGATLIYLLKQDMSSLRTAWIIIAIVWQTFLYTGLFITAHDAMHGAVIPGHRKANDLLGSIVVLLYALFSYRNLLAKHWEHHRHPASLEDPDYHDGKHVNFFAWYVHFMKNYIQWQQIAGMAIAFNILLHLFRVPIPNLILFWVLPSLLSTFQLFYFGTFLPHRDSGTPFADHHRARSSYLPVFLSLLTCYHFGGFHHEHHLHPNVAWWKLPGKSSEQ